MILQCGRHPFSAFRVLDNPAAFRRLAFNGADVEKGQASIGCVTTPQRKVGRSTTLGRVFDNTRRNQRAPTCGKSSRTEEPPRDSAVQIVAV